MSPRATVALASSVLLGILVPWMCVIAEYGAHGLGRALSRQLKHFSAHRSDVDQLLQATACQVTH